jgi:hypothetical protein
LGIAAVVINATAEAKDPRRDEHVRRSLLTALRILLGPGTVIVAVAAITTA